MKTTFKTTNSTYRCYKIKAKHFDDLFKFMIINVPKVKMVGEPVLDNGSYITVFKGCKPDFQRLSNEHNRLERESSVWYKILRFCKCESLYPKPESDALSSFYQFTNTI